MRIHFLRHRNRVSKVDAMEKLSETHAPKRLVFLARVAVLWILIIFARLVHLQVFRHGELRAKSDKQAIHKQDLRAQRGTILDRNGIPLAMSIEKETLSVNPIRIPDAGVAADLLSMLLEVKRDDLYNHILMARSQDQGYLIVKKHVAIADADRVRVINLDYVDFEKESVRIYPKGMLAAHVLGSVDHMEHGNAGLELMIDEDLEGITGMARTMTDSRGRILEEKIDINNKPRPGKDITLTIDERIQFPVEKILKAAVIKHAAITGSAIVLRVGTGEILAMASYPTFDPNEPPLPEETKNCRLNNAVEAPFEPGSVFKVITLSAALETTSLRPDSVIFCGNGSITLNGRTIRDTHSYGYMPMSDVLAKSSNVGAIRIGLTVGKTNLHEYVRKFGFGKKVGLPLPWESRGIVRSFKKWTEDSVASISMGHEVAISTLQLAQACSIVANNGVLVKPYVIAKTQRRGEAAEVTKPDKGKVVLKPETSFMMRQMMEGVILRGTGRHTARLEQYTAGGKTGSAQMYDFKTHKYTKRYNDSFMGFAPVTNPQIVVVVTLTGASQLASVVAGPAFKEISMAALRRLGVPKDIPEDTPHPIDNTEVESDLAIADLSRGPLDENNAGNDDEDDASDHPENAADVSGPRVPDFHGKTMRAVLEESSAKGLQVEIRGNGIARSQTPPAGSVLARGGRIKVQFTR
jgi:cell division protein FtsI (penicillin-binding protein 3)